MITMLKPQLQRLIEPFYLDLEKYYVSDNSKLHKFIWWLVKKLKIKVSKEVSREIINYQFDEQNLFDKLRLTAEEMKKIWDLEAKYIVVGRDIEMIRDMMCDYYDKFDINVKLKNMNEIKIFGMTVVYVPWIEGICVLPELAHYIKIKPLQTGFSKYSQ